MPHLSCSVCGHSRETSLSELQRSGYWPGNIPAKSDRHGRGDLKLLQEEIEGLTVSIKRCTQRLYSQTDSNKRCHSLRHRRNEEKKKLAAAVEDYNRRADPSQKLGPVEDFFTDEAVALPWEIPSSNESGSFLTKRKIFDKVMAVRRLEEEKALILKEMKQHWNVLIQKTSKFEELINEITSKFNCQLYYKNVEAFGNDSNSAMKCQSLQTSKLHVAFRLAQEQCAESFVEWVFHEQLHPSHTSTSATQSVGCSGVKHTTTGLLLWSDESHFSIYQSDG
ncbi:Alanine--tRNA ligase [Labeo rohita]|uniref:Alanine--tRNA ligase n=1 Tax=Labeo rohita TaxID=84645 RepID=A0ABQ8M036_LABRO|nr:Alanine--tRNA ligase [Labeo rohita]